MLTNYMFFFVQKESFKPNLKVEMVCVSRIQTDIKADDLLKGILKLPAAQTQGKALVRPA